MRKPMSKYKVIIEEMTCYSVTLEVEDEGKNERGHPLSGSGNSSKDGTRRRVRIACDNDGDDGILRG